MTIPSRPAPPPPNSSQQQQFNSSQHHNGGVQKLTIKLPPPPTKTSKSTSLNRMTNDHSTTSSITRNFPTATSRKKSPFQPMSMQQQQINGISDEGNKKAPPPRPPPPKVSAGNLELKKPGAPPQSVSVLSNLFGRKKGIVLKKPPPSKIPPLSAKPNGAKQSQKNPLCFSNTSSFMPSSQDNDVQLIRFDSPPSSPTLTQKSNSDCVSVDSFSSDSNFSSPNNGSVSQPESGFEDDFIASRSTTSPSDPWETLEPFGGCGSSKSPYGDLKISAPVRNPIAINRMQSNRDDPLCNGRSLLPPAPTLTAPTIIKPKISQKPKAPKPPCFMMKPSKGVETVNINDGDLSGSPPMPSCPPPPPPISMLDVVFGGIDAINLRNDDSEVSGPAYGIALYDFDGLEDGDLSLRENEKIYLLQKLDDEWYMGRNKRGCEGIFPSTYIDIKIPLKESCIDSNSASLAGASNYQMPISVENSYKHISSRATEVRALYAFEAEQPEDLSLNENDLVTVLYRINEDWLYGEVAGKQGQFPANFLEYIPDNLPLP